VVAANAGVRPSVAAVSIDPERYGDKELLVAALNKIRQAIGNVCAEKPELLPSLLLLTISDALSYQKDSDKGGIDGSIRFELERESNAGLKAAADAVTEIRSGLLRTTQASYADVLALAGAEAIEVAGGPRCLVQIGREDAKAPEDEGLRAGFSWDSASATTLRSAFGGSGLSAQDIVALLGAVGTLKQTATRLRKEKAASAADAPDDDDIDQEDVFGVSGSVAYGSVPTGKTSSLSVNVKGDKLGKFDNSYFKSLLSSANSNSLSPLDRALLSDKELKSYVETYAGSKQKFREDVRATYARLQGLGGNFKGARMLFE